MIEKSKRRFLCIKFRACGLSFSEGIVLLVIGYSKYSNQDTISSLSGIDKYQTAKVLAAMEERGYIRREINPENKREKLVCLSEKGKEAANSLKDIMDQWEKIIFAGITAQEERALERIMCKIVGNVGSMKEILEGRNCNNNETGKIQEKKVIVAAAAVILCAIVLVLIFGHVTGDDLLFKNKKNLVVQSYVTMDESNINALTGGQIKDVLVEEGGSGDKKARNWSVWTVIP